MNRRTLSRGRELSALGVLCLMLVSYGCASVSPGQSGGSPARSSDWWIPPAKSAQVVMASSNSPIRLFVTRPILSTHAPVPVGREERLVFALLYETLMQQDHRGQVVGMLADRWEPDEAGRVWTMRMADRRYSDGSRVQADHVWLSWERSRKLHPRWSFWSCIESVYPTGNEIRITLREAKPDLPTILCDPRLAVARLQEAPQWPLGTGAYVLRVGREHGHQKWILEPGPESDPSVPLEVHLIKGADARDLPALGADILLVENKTDAKFFSRRPDEFHTVALNPDAVYALWTPAGWAGKIEVERLSELTVSVLARPFELPVSEDGFRPGPTADIWFDEEDRSARALARGLAASVSPSRFVHGVPEDELWSAALSRTGAEEGRALVLRYESLLEARNFHSSGVLQGLIQTYPVLVARKGVSGVGKTRSGGVDLSRTRLESLEDLP